MSISWHCSNTLHLGTFEDLELKTGFFVKELMHISEIRIIYAGMILQVKYVHKYLQYVHIFDVLIRGNYFGQVPCLIYEDSMVVRVTKILKSK